MDSGSFGARVIASLLSPDFWTLGTQARGVEIPSPLPHQVPILQSAARFKLWRAGRRTGKSRCAFIAAVEGHGPGQCFRGLLDGADIIWLAPDYPQSAAIWGEEIRPRFANRPGFTVHESSRRVTRDAGGSLEIRSAESIDNIRGRQLDGVILDEGAYFDLEYAWTSVIRFALADRTGWAMICSTTNAGPDGNSLKRTPSYFNILSAKADQESLGPDWDSWHNRTDDNPALPIEEVAAMHAEYPEDSPTAQQELEALLVAGGLVAFPELSRSSHFLAREFVPRDLPSHWFLWGSFDWGYNHPFSFGLWAAAEDGRVIRVDTVTGRKLHPQSIASTIDATLERWNVRAQDLRSIAGGHDLWADHRARGETIPTLFEQFVGMGWKVKQANISRVSGVQNIRRYLVQPGRLTIYDTPGNRVLYANLESRISDPKNPEDVLKQDADQNGVGGDDCYDEFRYGLGERPLAVHAPATQVEGDDRSPKIDWKHGGRIHRVTAEEEIDKIMGVAARTQARQVARRPRW